jgi:hypothetical protein
MKHLNKHILSAALLAAVGFFNSAQAAYPDKHVTVVVPSRSQHTDVLVASLVFMGRLQL